METLFRRGIMYAFFVFLCALTIALPLATDVTAYLTFEPIKVLMFIAGGAGIFFFLLLASLYGLFGGLFGKFFEGRFFGKLDEWAFWRYFLIFLPFLLFFISLILSTVFSAAPWVSFWGLYPRYHGFLLLGSAFLVFVAVFFVPRHLIRRVLDLSLVIGAAVGLIGILERFFPELTQYWDIAFFLERTFSTLGHPNFLADYLLYLLPVFCFGFFFRKRWWMWLILVSPVLLAFLLTLSRGALLGLLMSMLLFGCVYALWKKRFVFVGLALVFPVFLLVLFVYANVHYSSTFTTSTNFVERLKISGENLRSVESRFTLWPTALRYGLERPILGHGPDMFAYTFGPFTPQKILEMEDFRSYADRAHNVLLDTFGMFGGLGVAALLSILGMLFWIVMRVRDPYLLALFCGIFGVFVSQQFGFPISAHYFLFWLFAGVIVREGAGYVSGVSGVSSNNTSSKHILSGKNANTFGFFWRGVMCFFFLIGVAGLGFFEYRFVYASWKADRAARSANEQFEEGSREHIALMNDAVESAPQRMQYQILLARSLLFSLQREEDALAKTLIHARLIELLTRLERETNGQDFRVYWYFGQTFSEDGDAVHMREAYDHALRLAPMYSALWYSYGSAKFSAGLFEEAIDTWRHYVSLAPPYWQWHERYAKGTLTPWEKNRYEIFYKQNPDFDDVFDRIEEAKLKLQKVKSRV